MSELHAVPNGDAAGDVSVPQRHTIEAFSICPLMSRVIEDPAAVGGSRTLLAPCIGAGCKMFVPLEMREGQIVRGDCFAQILPLQVHNVSTGIVELKKLMLGVSGTDSTGRIIPPFGGRAS